MDPNDIDTLKLKLRLYIEYVDILEHLCVFDGSLRLSDKVYDNSRLKRGGRSWLNKMREIIAQRLSELEG